MYRGLLPSRTTGYIIQYSLEVKELYSNSTTKQQAAISTNFQIETRVGHLYTETYNIVRLYYYIGLVQERFGRKIEDGLVWVVTKTSQWLYYQKNSTFGMFLSPSPNSNTINQQLSTTPVISSGNGGSREEWLQADCLNWNSDSATYCLSLGWFLNLFVPPWHQWSNNRTSCGIVRKVK